MPLVCVAPVILDGDSLRCQNVGQVRLLGIDAPDYSRSRPCREGFGDHVGSNDGARKAKASLARAIRYGPVQLTPAGRDHYGRLLAIAQVGATILNCWQLEAGVARYIVRYDAGRQVARICGL